MQILTKCILLPIDGTDESLRPVTFISRLYPTSEVSLILCYFSPPLPPAYSGAVAQSPELSKKRDEFFQARQQDVRRLFSHARQVLLKAGFAEELIQEHIEQRQISVAKQACLLADIKKVDAVVVHKQVTSSLEGFIRGDLASALLERCLTSPVWFTEGEIDPKSARNMHSKRRRIIAGCGPRRLHAVQNRFRRYSSARGKKTVASDFMPAFRSAEEVTTLCR